MRPKKRVLVYCADEMMASHMAFVLDVRGYIVTPCDSLELLRHELDWKQRPLDAALVIETEVDRCGVMVPRLIKQSDSLTTVLLLVQRMCDCPSADIVLLSSASQMDVLERVRVLTVRKRGPRRAYRAAREAARESVCA